MGGSGRGVSRSRKGWEDLGEGWEDLAEELEDLGWIREIQDDAGIAL